MKRLTITPKIEALMRAAYGADADIAKLAVFEFVAANLNPLRKRSGMYERARFSEGALREMMDLVARESVQLILNHNDETMPVGRVFAAELKGEDLHVLVGIPMDTQAALVADIESGTLDQVSVGILPASLLCSECGFDYMGDGANFENWWDRTCSNGHEIGVDGVHARITSIASWFEMSLVGMGAVPGARSVPKENSAFSEGQFPRLAASGVPAHVLACSCSVDQPKPKENTMDLKEFSTQLTAAVTDKVAAEAKLTATEAKLTAANEQVTTLTATVAERDTTIEELTATVADRDAKLAEAPSKETYDAMLASLKDVTKKARVALGEHVEGEDLPNDATALLEMFNAAQAKLTAIIPTGVVSSPADQPTKLSANPSARAFTTTL